MITSAILGLVAMFGGQDVKLPHHTFEKDEEGWVVYQSGGEGSNVAVSHEPAHLKEGKGSLAFNYKISSGQFGILSHPIEVGKLASMQSMHFWVQSDHDTTLLLTMQEHEGGRYSATFHVPKSKWQEVQLGLSDFLIATEADAPKDPNGKLDTDQIESISVIDAEEFLFQNAALATALGLEMGNHSLYLSDFKVSDAMLPNVASTNISGVYNVDDFSRTQMDWAGLGLTSMAYAIDSPFPGKWVKVDYKTNASRISAVAKPLKLGALTGMKKLSLQFGSTRQGQVMVQIEQVNGAKFMTILDVPGKAQSKQFDIPIADLKISDDSPDKNAKMDLSQMKQLVIVDISGRTLGTDDDNTLYIGPITASH